jgi:hypothetical protein
LPSGTTKLLIKTTPGQWTPDGSGNQIVSCTKGASNTFAYTGVSSDPTGTHPFATGTWEYPMQGGFILGPNSDAVWMSNVLSGPYASYGFDTVFDAPVPSGKNLMMATPVPGGWRLEMPGTINPGTRPGGYKFIQCGTIANPPPTLTFGQLPPVPTSVLGDSTPGWLPMPMEGDEYSVTDCAQTVGFRGVVTSGGGSNHYKLRRNESGQWIRVG